MITSPCSWTAHLIMSARRRTCWAWRSYARKIKADESLRVHGGMAAVMCCHPERGETDSLNWQERARLCVVIVCRDSLSNESQLPVPSRTGKHGPARVNAFPTPVLFLPTTRQYYLLSSRASPSLSLPHSLPFLSLPSFQPTLPTQLTLARAA